MNNNVLAGTSHEISVWLIFQFAAELAKCCIAGKHYNRFGRTWIRSKFFFQVFIGAVFYTFAWHGEVERSENRI
ncbi:MAG: hypothetical protein IBX69_03825 [Anaerolineales bacterium]|nr:hypothetical protein [Anaerolineales bacterium]